VIFKIATVISKSCTTKISKISLDLTLNLWYNTRMNNINNTNDSTFALNTRNAKIQGLSVQVGELFADMYRDPHVNGNYTLEALEAYKALRRMLPLEEGNPNRRHVGRKAAHRATQGR